MTTTLDPATAWAAYEQTQAVAAPPPREYKHYRPLAAAARNLVHEIQSGGRIDLGIPVLDEAIRGVAPGQLMLLNGYNHCMTPDHEVLTHRGWRGQDEIRKGDRVWTVNPTTRKGEWDRVQAVNIFDHDGPLNRLIGLNIDAFVTDNHRWAVTSQYAQTHPKPYRIKETTDLNTSDYLPLAVEGAEPETETFSDAYVEIAAWIFTEGNFHANSGGITIFQSPRVNRPKCDRIEKALAELGWDYTVGYRVRESGSDENSYRIAAPEGHAFRDRFPNKMATTEFVDALTVRQRKLLIDILILGDGYIANSTGIRRYFTSREDEAAVVAHLFAASGTGFSVRRKSYETGFGHCVGWLFTEKTSKHCRYARIRHNREHYVGTVWCPTTANGIILVRRNGRVYYTHNSGKSLIAHHCLRWNKNRRIAMFVPDEPTTLVIAKLAAASHGLDGIKFEEDLARNDHEAMRLLMETAEREFPNLAVFDQTLTPAVMEEGLEEAEDVWGAKAELLVIDYVELLQAGESVQAKFDYIKSFGRRHNLPVIALHQTSRTAGADGRAMTISSGSYGGEQHATYVLGVRRKKMALLAERADLRTKLATATKDPKAVEDKLREVEHDLRIHEYTVTVNLVKNKQIGAGTVDEVDFELDTSNGRIYPLNGDLPNAYQRLRAYEPATQGEMDF